MSDAGTTTPLGGLKTDLPLMLFPVRLETRFVMAGAAPQLLVRVYPDDVHVDAHDPELTDAERTWGQHFWVQTWRAGDDEALQRAAWIQLAQQFGGPRAAWIADTLTPTNATNRPSTSLKPDDPLPVPPAFPTVPRRASAWTRAPQTRVLPDRWVALGFAGGQRVLTFVGSPIPDRLAVGPSPDPQRGFDAESIAADPDAGWLIDFGAAERVGMALRIPYTVPGGAPLDRLVVMGAKPSLSGATGQARVQDLLRGHYYTGGLSFLPQATPTNNTPDVPSGFHSREPEYAAGPLASVSRSSIPVGDGSNRDMMARALGIGDEIVSRMAHAGDPEQRDAYHMNTAIWKATWGYFMDQVMAGPGSPSDDAIRLGREHFSSYVRARGPLPAIRIGRQPYGLLPAISLDRWRPRDGSPIDGPLRQALIGLRQIWRRAVATIPRLPRSENSAASLLQVLAMGPTSVGYTVRRAQVMALLSPSAAQPRPTVGSSEARRLAQTLGLGWVPRQVRTVLAPYTQITQLDGALVRAATPPEAGDPRAYVRWLGDALPGDIRTERLPFARPNTLLYLILRHAALLEHVGAAVRVLLKEGLITSDQRREPDVPTTQTRTPWAMLETAVPRLGIANIGGHLQSIRKRLWDELREEPARDLGMAGSIWRRDVYEVAATGPVTEQLAPEVRELVAFTRSLAYLAALPVETLERLLPESLDLCSHRLDAWVTSFATRRLDWLRGRTPRGIYLGGYGWVEDLGPGAPRQVVQPPQLPAAEPPAPELAAPLFAPEGSQGFVHAPSLRHATTAAILRSGYLGRRATGDGNLLAVNLSSDRVRTALWLLDGIRQGQGLDALLGYRFERGLHENHPGVSLDRYIARFRRLAPLAGAAPAPTGAVESQPAGNVVDGLALLRRWQAGNAAASGPRWTDTTIPFGEPAGAGQIALPPAAAANPEFRAIAAELGALEDAVDAIGDLVIAESVHQVAQGNPARAGATMEAVAQGEAPPPELDVARTPRTGIGLTHRLVVLWSGVPGTPGWGTPTSRARAEPFLNAWMAQLLGPNAPAARCRVEYLDPASGAPLVDAQRRPLVRDVTLAELGLSPLDLVYLPEGEGQAQQSELEQRVTYLALRARPVGAPESAVVRLSFARTADAPLTTLSTAEVLEQARTACRLILGARPLRPRDLAQPDLVIPPAAEADDEPAGEPANAPEKALRLANRTQAAVDALRSASRALDAAIPTSNPQATVPETVRGLLMRIAAFGVLGAVPTSAVGDTPAIRTALAGQADGIAREVRERLERVDDLEKAYRATASPTPAATREYHVARLREVFGREFQALSRFTPPNAADLTRTFGANVTLQGGNIMEVITWFQRAARVRDGAARLDSAFLYAEALGGITLSLTVGQLPIVDVTRDRWIGLPMAPETPAPGGRLSLVVHAPAGIVLTRPVAGLLIDEWVEVIPSAEETTGLAFHFDQPSSRAPQAILLAVAPDDRPTWDLDTLEATVLETIELARLRTVDPAALAEVDQFLPALYFGNSPSGAAVSTDFSRLTAPPNQRS